MIRSLLLTLLLVLPPAAGSATQFRQPTTILPNIDALTNHGWTPLFAAAGRGMVEEARFFLDHGADPNWQIPATSTLKDTGGYPMVGRTPLLVAVFGSNRKSRRQLVELLLAYGADPTLADAVGDSPLSLVSGERIPGVTYSRRHKNRQLEQLMRAYMDAERGQPLPGVPATPDPVTVCLEPGDTRFSDLALRHLGDRARWPEMVRLNGLKADESVTVGDCFLLPPR